MEITVYKKKNKLRIKKGREQFCSKVKFGKSTNP